MNRLLQVNSHLTNPGAADVRTKNDGDVVIIASYRTPIAKGGKGSFKDMNSDELLYKFTKEFIKKLPPQFDLRKIEDVVIGNVLNHGAGAIEHRAALLSAGLDSSIPFMAINRQCSSGLMAINDIANKIISHSVQTTVT
ncbi:hypothetical protein PACTADRAFT_33096 [Pachysolen tannophilus NRRL Y-2460]|uniref:Thiolase N-terminal domain-containing protein n=1 Tax=Pachysolen tannophilus NRRL Y-2460 TaxID=669874 RepID=A0A1E4TVY7_PACTA|nr:hypothetical protein PACTADRAFT_33096 [Pachysolen tannophilus NRRL Y-2460]